MKFCDCGARRSESIRLEPKSALGEISLSELEESGVLISGDPSIMSYLVSMLDQFPAWFPIATPDLKYEAAKEY